MIVVNKTARAEQDLLDIWLYTFRTWGEVQADRYLDELDLGIRLLAENPNLGSDYGHICDGYRRLSINYHRVFYRFAIILWKLCACCMKPWISTHISTPNHRASS